MSQRLLDCLDTQSTWIGNNLAGEPLKNLIGKKRCEKPLVSKTFPVNLLNHVLNYPRRTTFPGDSWFRFASLAANEGGIITSIYHHLHFLFVRL